MSEQIKNTINYHFIKSNGFRVVHCDGMWGGVTPRGYITMSIFSERWPLPQKTTHKVLDGGHIDAEIKRDLKDGIVREVDVEVILDLGTAESMVTWLQEHISTLKKHLHDLQKGKQ